jgi:hypothetical protein
VSIACEARLADDPRVRSLAQWRHRTSERRATELIDPSTIPSSNIAALHVIRDPRKLSRLAAG